MSNHIIYLPSTLNEARIEAAPAPVPEPEPPPKPPPPTPLLSVMEREFLYTMRYSELQQRQTLVIHPVLQLAAAHRTEDMLLHDYFGHTDLLGFGPNWHARRLGYALPEWYGQKVTANSIESLAKNFRQVDRVWAALLASPGHRAHLLGENAFFAAQTQCGISIRELEHLSGMFILAVLTAHPE